MKKLNISFLFCLVLLLGISAQAVEDKNPVIETYIKIVDISTPRSLSGIIETYYKIIALNDDRTEEYYSSYFGDEYLPEIGEIYFIRYKLEYVSGFIDSSGEFRHVARAKYILDYWKVDSN